jgi:glutamyl-tRNA synthetase
VKDLGGGGRAPNAGVRGRYAPSPTGSLHFGNLRTALLAWLMAREKGGSFVLRVEDLDLPRVVAGSSAGIVRDLSWLGLDWDEGPDVGGPCGPYYQSARQDIYRAVLAELATRGLLYPCFCTRADLARVARAKQEGDDTRRYPGTCRHLTRQRFRQYQAEGRPAALRLRVRNETLEFADLVAGRQRQSPARHGGDFVVLRADGIVSYQLAVVVDDALMGISQVVRGADLLDSTFRQLALYRALGYPVPTYFAHVPLVRDETGARLAKRDRSVGLESVRDRGMTPGWVLGRLAASCGIWPDGEPARASDLLTTFDGSRLAGISHHVPVS